MIKATITIDGLNYGGEDHEKSVVADVGGSGWHISNHHELDSIIIGCEQPKVIIGKIGMRSELDKIIRRMELGLLTANQIIIKIVN